MDNPFLNANTKMATSNPQANVNQASNNQPQAVVQNNNNQINGTNNNSNFVNPITIPIQIQPQVATSRNNNSVNYSNLQTNNENNNNISQTYNASTPQNYNNNSNKNVVDFNQIYSSYQNKYETNNYNTSTSGVKKTSIGTTIVTPTTSNLNSVQGQYQSAYADTVNSLIGSMLSQISGGFNYDPTTDNSLQIATEYASNSTLQSLAGSGVLNSSATAERVARVVSELIPQYEQLAYTRWTDYLGHLADTAQLVMNYDSQQFEYWKDSKDREFEEKQLNYKKQQDALENAWKRVDALGYVDNEASALLGIAVGTLSGEARLAKEQREFELAKMKEQAKIEYDNNVALYKLKSELDLEQSKTLADYESNIKKTQTKYEYELAQKYSNTSNASNQKESTTSLSTYKDIINNRWADYDEFSGKYTSNDNTALYNYLSAEYSSGRMSKNDFMSLVALYNVTVPTDKSQNSNVRRFVNVDIK